MRNRDWTLAEVGSLGKVITGRTPPSTNPEFFGDKLPFLTPTDMTGSRRIEQPERHLSPEGANVFRRLIVDQAVAVSCIGWQLGKVVLVDQPSLTNQQINSVVVDDSLVNRNFLYYALLLKRGDLFRLASGGSRTPIVSKSTFEKILIPLPPRRTQDYIASTLGILDDKIELNRRMNQTLEAMARAIFKFWFVDFEPAEEGHPSSTETACIRNLAAYVREAITPREFPKELFEHYSIPAYDEGKVPKLEAGEGIRSNKYLVPAGVVLLSKLNPRIPRVWLPSVSPKVRSICSTEFLVMAPKSAEFDREFIYSLFLSSELMETFASRATGTSGSHQRVRPEDLLQIEVPFPIEAVRKEYSAIARPLFDQVAQNHSEIRTLATLRDTLLPKLLSGEIRVQQAEKIVESAL